MIWRRRKIEDEHQLLIKRMRLAHYELHCEYERIKAELREAHRLLDWYEDMYADPPTREQLVRYRNLTKL